MEEIKNHQERRSQMPNALLSVFNKGGIVDFAKELVKMGWTIYSSGGTGKELQKNGVPVIDVATLVGGEAILGHRVVTLSREVHAGLLARRIDADIQELEKLGIPWINLVCNDLYPLPQEIKRPGSTKESVIEMTDIGGPTLLRSAAKGRRIVICDPSDRQKVLEWLKNSQPDHETMINSLAAKAEFTVAKYVLTSAEYHGEGLYAGLMGTKVLSCKYGENAYQTPAGLYSCGTDDPLALDKFQPIAGDAPSYNNMCDLERLLQTMTHIAAGFDVNRGIVPYMAVGVKHGNSCGSAGYSMNKTEILKKMIDGDDLALFGGLVMVNFVIDEELAEVLLSYNLSAGVERRSLDGLIAPGFDGKAVEMLRRKKDKCRFIANPALTDLGENSLDQAMRFRYVRGGFLHQPNYTFVLNLKDPDLVKTSQATVNQENDLILAKGICDTSNSNTITIVKERRLIGNGVGQQARVRGAMLAVNQTIYCKHDSHGAVAASDSFFPFLDGPEVLAEAGIKAIVSTSGSIADSKVKEFCQEKNIALYLIPDKKGRGFFGH